MRGFLPAGQTELNILVVGAGIGAAIGLPKAGLTGLLVGAVLGSGVMFLLLFGFIGVWVEWVVARLMTVVTRRGHQSPDEDAAHPDD